MTPFGSSLRLRWPEFGLTLEPKGNFAPGDEVYSVEVGRFRAGDREVADWPQELDRNPKNTIPWTPRWPQGGRWSRLERAQIPF